MSNIRQASQKRTTIESLSYLQTGKQQKATQKPKSPFESGLVEHSTIATKGSLKQDQREVKKKGTTLIIRRYQPYSFKGLTQSQGKDHAT